MSKEFEKQSMNTPSSLLGGKTAIEFIQERGYEGMVEVLALESIVTGINYHTQFSLKLQSENIALRKLVEEANDLMTETVDYDENPEKYQQWLEKARK